MTPASAKAKGRKLQQIVVEIIRRLFKLPADDVRSTSMGAGGEDVQLSNAAKKLIPFSIECKNKEKPKAIWDWYDQAVEHAKGDKSTYPLVICKKNQRQPLAILDAELFFRILRKAQATKITHDIEPGAL